MNISETVLICICYLSILLHLIVVKSNSDDLDLISSTLLFIRAILQIVRIVLIIKSTRSVQKNIEEIVDFNSVFNQNESFSHRNKAKKIEMKVNKKAVKEVFSRIDTKEVVIENKDNNLSVLKNIENFANNKEFGKKLSKNNLMDNVDYKEIKLSKEKNKDNINEFLND